jgi:hypothetical protein
MDILGTTIYVIWTKRLGNFVSDSSWTITFFVDSDEIRPQSYFTSLEVRNEYRYSIPGSIEFAKSTTTYRESGGRLVVPLLHHR